MSRPLDPDLVVPEVDQLERFRRLRYSLCARCCEPFEQTWKGRPREFCTSGCAQKVRIARRAWRRRNPDARWTPQTVGLLPLPLQ